ncbi:MAG: hypothetical protein IJC25_02205 [Clostridia bacterium]|nr:hypothetical protein [Clostridia bacterium]
MKKLLALALILLLLLSLAACAAEPQQAVGLSLEEAGITATIPFKDAEPVVDDFYPYTDRYPTLSLGISHEKSEFLCFDLLLNDKLSSDVFMGNYSTLGMGWDETPKDMITAPWAIRTSLAFYQAYRKSDLEAGGIIRLELQFPQPERSEIAQSSSVHTLVIDKKNVESSHYLVAETEEYYVFDWREFLFGEGPDAYLYHFRTYASSYWDSFSGIHLPSFTFTVRALLNLTQNVTFIQQS